MSKNDNNLGQEFSKRKLLILGAVFSLKYSRRNLGRNICKLLKKKYILFIIVLISIIDLIILRLYLGHILKIEKDTLHYFYSAISQSMAALFGVTGMFSVFRFQSIDNKLKHLYETIKNKFNENEWWHYFGPSNSNSWADSEVYERITEKLKLSRQLNIPPPMIQELEKRAEDISKCEIIKLSLLSNSVIPFLLIFITLIISVIGIVFCSFLSGNVIGIVILMVTLFLTTIAVTTTFDYIYSSLVSYLKESFNLGN